MGLENPLHIILLLLVVLLVFGAKRLPEMGRGLGDGMRSFKDAISGNSSEHEGITAHLHEAPEAPVATPAAAVTTETAPAPAPKRELVETAS